jgi:integrase
LSQWLDLPLRSITSDMVEDRHRSIVVEIGKGDRYAGASTANGVLRTFRVLWNFAADRTPDLPPNPIKRLKRQWYAEPRRVRIVSTADLPKFYQAVCALPNPVASDYLKILLFTGMRRTEAATLRWENIDLVEGVIRIPAENTKSKRKLDLPMSDFVRDLLIARRALGDAGFVFPGPARSGHIGDPVFPLRTVAKSSGVTVCAHDLRRTFLTVAEACDISHLALKAMVNHSMGGDITAGYVQINVERLREPVQRVANKMKELCGITPPAGKNVSPLRRGKVRDTAA